MTIADSLKIILDTRLTNPVLFYGCVAGVLILIFWVYKAIKSLIKKHKTILIKENQRIEKDRLTKLEADIKEQYYDSVVSRLRPRVNIKDEVELKASTENSKIETEKRVTKEIKISTEKVRQESEDKNEVKLNISKRKTSTPYFDTNEVQVKVIKSIPEPGSSTPKRIGYLPSDKFKQTEPYNYAVVKMPSKNCLIKFPRKGRSDKKRI